MITNLRALEDAYVPRDLHHREGQINQMTAALEPLVGGHAGEDLFVFGPSGAGKTTTTRYVLRQLDREASIRWGYVNCISDSGKSAVLHRLLRDAELGHDLRQDGTAPSRFLNRLRDLDEQFVAILDEVDVLADHDVLMSLYEIPNVTLVLVTLDEDDFFARLDGRLQSRLRGACRVELRPYGHDEMVDILRSRVKAALRPGMVRDDVLDHIADIATGDARYGIALLRRAARHVETNDGRYITVDVVDGVVGEARDVINEQRVAELSTEKRILFELIAQSGRISASDLRARYKQQRSDPVASRTRRKYLRALEEHYGLIASSGTGRGKVFYSNI
ncbi:cell division control protein Cdc6 [Halarchaeum grantii]|uniref:Cell division control protein Cdc6 n=1 Tax=Halarchaeum grantii TaxID=1193105 RepID=A0A830ESK2_9EURY|nr:Cdc6/Cdc18 family protein [Halarchaeum grantii]GGL26000.1 cell division control protein Cdc6 [Halarchaeum grantii]